MTTKKRDIVIQARLNDREKDMLNEVCDTMQIKPSEAIRLMLAKFYETLKP